MDKTMDSMYGGIPPYMSAEMNNMGMGTNFEQPYFDNNMFNPVTQYEQAYMYYRYMTQQIEYKIKCKELEQLSTTSNISKKNIS